MYVHVYILGADNDKCIRFNYAYMDAENQYETIFNRSVTGTR